MTQEGEIDVLEKTVSKKFNRKDGPFYKALDKSLNAMYVQRQAYQGGTFVGNHVHKVLKVGMNSL